MDTETRESLARIEEKLDILILKLGQAEQIIAAFSNGTGKRLMAMMARRGGGDE